MEEFTVKKSMSGFTLWKGLNDGLSFFNTYSIWIFWLLLSALIGCIVENSFYQNVNSMGVKLCLICLRHLLDEHVICSIAFYHSSYLWFIFSVFFTWSVLLVTHNYQSCQSTNQWLCGCFFIIYLLLFLWFLFLILIISILQFP